MLVCPTDFRMWSTYILVYYVYMYSIAMAIGPLILLICEATAIVATITLRKRNRRRAMRRAIRLTMPDCQIPLRNVGTQLANGTNHTQTTNNDSSFVGARNSFYDNATSEVTLCRQSPMTVDDTPTADDEITRHLQVDGKKNRF